MKHVLIAEFLTITEVSINTPTYPSVAASVLSTPTCLSAPFPIRPIVAHPSQPTPSLSLLPPFYMPTLYSHPQGKKTIENYRFFYCKFDFFFFFFFFFFNINLYLLSQKIFANGYLLSKTFIVQMQLLLE